MADYDDAKKSRFNAGIAQTERIDSLQRAINGAKFNPLMKNFETGTYGYEIIMDALDVMIDEGWEKFTTKEREIVLRMNKVLRSMHKFFPPISLDKDNVQSINKINYDKFMEFARMFGRKLKEYYGNHDLNAPNYDEDDEGY